MKHIGYALKDIERSIDIAIKNYDPLKKGLTMQIKTDKPVNFYRFQVYTSTQNQKPKIVGMAYLQEGQSIYSLRLWTFLNEKFYLLRCKDDVSKFLVMTRESNKNAESKNKYYWNIVGNGATSMKDGSIEISFDLFDKKIYMSLLPDESNKHGARFYPNISEVA